MKAKKHAYNIHGRYALPVVWGATMQKQIIREINNDLNEKENVNTKTERLHRK